MADIEKVMSWLEGLAQPDWREYHSDSEVQSIAQVALKLLKEQEAVEPHSHLTEDDDLYFTCGKCGNVIWSESYKYCPTCGLKVAWNGER